MSTICYVEREMTGLELQRMNAGFSEHGLEFGNPIETAERFGFVAQCGSDFVGCSSGLAYKHERGYANWFYLSDLFVEKSFRRQGLGAELLKRLETKVAGLGLKFVYTWTAGYEAPEFYRRQGYEIFTELEEYYVSGHSRVGLRKRLNRESICI